MTNTEYRRLRAFEYAIKHAPRQPRNLPSKRSVRGAAKHVGRTDMKNGRVIPQVGMDKLFIERK